MGALLSFLGLATPLAVGVFLDKWIAENVKRKMARIILRKRNNSNGMELHDSLKQLSLSLEGSRFTKLNFMILMSLVGIIFIYSGQYFVNSSDFNDYTMPFIELFFNNPFKFLLYLICFIIVDCFSFFQTYRFLMLSRGAKGLADVFFIIFADIFLSLSLVMFLLPLLMSATYYLTSPIQENDFYVVIDNKNRPETFTLRQFIDSVAPRVIENSPSNTEERDLDELYKAAFSENWVHSHYLVSVEQYTAGKTISDAADGLKYTAGSNSILYTYNTSLENLGRYIEKIISSAPGINSVEMLDFAETQFSGRSVLLFRVKGQNKANFSDVFSSYFYNLGGFNFFNEELKKIKSISNMGIKENSILTNALYQNLSPYAFRDFSLICGAEEKPKKLKLNSEVIDNEISNCVHDGALVSSAFITKFSLLSAFDYKSNFQIPILPTALSSLLLTALIYTFALIWLLSPFLAIGLEHIIRGGAETIEKHIFTVFSGLLIGIFCLLGLMLN